VNEVLREVRARDMEGSADSRTHYYAPVSNERGAMLGCADDVPVTPDPSVVASGPAGSPGDRPADRVPTNSGWETDGTFADWYAAHEIAHTLGRAHIQSNGRYPCGSELEPIDSKYPVDSGQLADRTSAYEAFDPGDRDHAIPMVAFDGVPAHDFMTYCDSLWISSYTYEAIYKRLEDEDRPTAPVLADAGPRSTGAGGGALANGPPSSRPSGDSTIPYLKVRGQINFTQHTGHFTTSPELLSTIPRQTGSTDARVRIVVRDSLHATLGRFNARLFFGTDQPDTSDSKADFEADVPRPPEATEVALIVSNNELYVRHLDNVIPVVRISTDVPASGPPDSSGRLGVLLRWDADDRSTPVLYYTVQIRFDADSAWQTIAIRYQNKHYVLEPSQYSHNTKVYYRIWANDGSHESIAVSSAVKIPQLADSLSR
jgi:hypothetical protein